MTDLITQSQPSVPGLPAVESDPYSGRKLAIAISVGLVSLLGALFIGYCRNTSELYKGLDGSLYLALFKIGTSSHFFSSSEISRLQGMGSQVLPINPWVNPGYIGFTSNTTFPMVMASYLFFTACHFLAICFLGRSLKIGIYTCIIAAQIATLLTFPPLSEHFHVYLEFELNPGVAYLIAIILVALGILIRIDATSTARCIGLTTLLVLLALYIVFCDPLWTVGLNLTILPFAGACLLMDRQRRPFLWRCAAVAVVLLVLAVLRVPTYLWELLASTARVQFRTEIIGEIQDYEFAFLPFQNATLRVIFVIMLAGIIMALWSKERPIRLFAWACIIHMLIMTGVSLVYLYTDINWTYPLPVYLQLPTIPIYVLLATAGWRLILQRAKKYWAFLLRPNGIWVTPLVSAAAAALGLVMIIRQPESNRPNTDFNTDWANPDQGDDLVNLLSNELKWKPNSAFNGSVATVFDRAGQDQVRELLTHLWLAAIPTLEEYGQLVSPQLYYLATRGLGDPADGLADRNRIRVTVPRVELLRAMGVRMVISQQMLDPSRFPLQLRGKFLDEKGHLIWFYELPNPNTGNFSPTHVVVSQSASEMVKQIISPTMKLDRDVVLTEPLDAKLVPAEFGAVQFADGKVEIKAKSSGQSLLLLPLQYSHALTVRSMKGPVRLLRANLAQTAVLFEGELDAIISLDFGVGAVGGKAQDIADLKILGIGEDGTRQIDPTDQDRFQPHMIFRWFRKKP
jgi:hypothetical protein